MQERDVDMLFRQIQVAAASSTIEECGAIAGDDSACQERSQTQVSFGIASCNKLTKLLFQDKMARLRLPVLL
jgi:hypothetical protein